jgi:L-rhamnose-H+ transport protein
MDMLLGIIAVSAGGLLMGSGAWPFKLLRKFQFEHWWFIGMLVGLLILPWAITLAGCPHALAVFRTLPAAPLIKANLLSLAWGVANVLCGLCFVRIGVALTGAILAGLGVSVGTIVPMVFKGTGLFKDAADVGSRAGLVVLAGVGVMLIGVLLAAAAGFGRDRVLKSEAAASPGAGGRSKSFAVGLIMAAASGVLSAGMALSFVYSQGPIVEAMEARGASDLAANCSVWAVGLLAGAVLNIGYAAYLMTRNKSWLVLKESWREAGLAAIIGIDMILAIVLMGKGMRFLGAFGASVGFGIQQAMQMTGNQALGFISGEWRGVRGRPRRQMYATIAVLMIAAVIMAYGKKLAAR